jgi:uncharacterized membrane protein
MVDLLPSLNATPSNPSCVINAMNGSRVLNISAANISIESSEGYHMAVSWTPTVASGFVEGQNYEVVCSLTVLGATVSGLEQYVYVNPHKTIMARLADFVTYVGQLLGLVRQPVQVTQITQLVNDGVTKVVASVVRGTTPISGAPCNMTIIDANGIAVASNVNMSVFGVSTLGMYNASFVGNTSLAPYAVRIGCLVNDSSGAITGYQSIGTLAAPPAVAVAVNATQIFEGQPSVKLFQTTIIAGTVGQILAQVKIGSNSVTNAVCNLTAYNSTLGKLVNNGQMSYSGDDGVYNYTWSPVALSGYAIYPTRVSCYGGNLGTMTVQDSSSIEVQGGVIMQMVT